MATPERTPNTDEIVSEIEIAAPLKSVFQALVDPGQVVRWWGQAGIYRCSEFQSDLRVGGKWRAIGVTGDGNRFEASGEYLQIEPPRRLVQTWMASWTGDFKTTVHWELESTKQGTLVRIRHNGLSARPELRQSYTGWPRMLGWLQALLERGESIDDRKPGSWS